MTFNSGAWKHAGYTFTDGWWEECFSLRYQGLRFDRDLLLMCHLLVTDMSHLSDVSIANKVLFCIMRFFQDRSLLWKHSHLLGFSQSILLKQVLGLPPPQAALRWLPVFCDVFQLEKPKRGSVHGLVVSKNSSEATAIDGTQEQRWVGGVAGQV